MEPVIFSMRRWRNFIFALAGGFALVLPCAAIAQDPEPAQPPVEALLQTIQRLQSDPEALAAAIESMKQRADEARKALESTKPKADESAAKLKELTERAESLRAQSQQLSDQLEAAKKQLAQIEAQLPDATKQAADQNEASQQAQAKLQLLEKISAALAALGAPAAQPAAPKPEPTPAPAPAVAEQTIPKPDKPGAPKFTAEAVEFFEKNVRPVLANNCYECHNQKSKKGGLNLESYQALLEGGDSGPALVAGDPEKSLLVQAITWEDKLLVMPPEEKLPQEAIDALTEWVRMGAPWPEEKEAASAEPAEKTFEEQLAEIKQTHWSFQPVKNPALPEVNRADWASTPIDRFILAKLEEKNLAPSPRADKRTLIRRAYFDLIGLPPSAEEIEAFEQDDSPDAFAKVVDRLLAMPQYGERWARYWLDLARYADTKGYVFASTRFFPFSYTYRDYVISAFNEDLPYDRFILEQLAADKLDLGEDKRPLAAMGFLTLGRRFLNNIDDIVDDRIDVTTRTFMGLTVSCARCHDHKYDPIPTADYYSLYGVFRSSVEPDEPPLIAEPEPTEQYAEYQSRVAEGEKAVADYLAEKHIDLLTQLRSQSAQYMLAAHDAKKTETDDAFNALVGERKLHPPIVRRWQEFLTKRAESHDPILAPWFGFAALPEDEFTTRGLELARTYALNSDDEKKLNVVVADLFRGDSPLSMAQVAERFEKLFTRIDKEWGELLQAQFQIAAQKGEAAAPPAGLPDENEEAIRQLIYGADSPANVPLGFVEQLMDVPTRDRLTSLRNKVLDIKSTHPGRPPRGMVLVDANEPFNPYVFIRGNRGNKGPEVPRRFLALLTEGQREPFKEGSGRLELARAIASKDNPLTARVLVNRVWDYHFGAPLVSTASDFGLRSEPPVHGELLDYLAHRFMEEGWSIKKLHRLIMLSSAYRQSSIDNAEAREADPENKLLWRYNRRRLDFEAMRDSLLLVAGSLDDSMGGPAVDIVSNDYKPRRSVYGFIERQNLPGVFRTFDFANPDAHSPGRYATTVPQQALYMMNSPFVVDQVRALVKRPEVAETKSPIERIRAMYEFAYGREPRDAEIEMAAEFLATEAFTPARPEAGPPAWQYGYGSYSEDEKKLRSFDLLPTFKNGQWQIGENVPDPKLGWLVLHARGGHTGSPGLGIVRRWTAPRSGTVRIQGTLRHPNENGDGVEGYIASSAGGELGRWVAHNGEQKTEVERASVSRGDTIDFVVLCRENEGFDSFFWSPVIEMTESVASAAELADTQSIWSARNDFSGPPAPQPEPLNAWEELAQVLLLSNEFMFID